MLQQTEVSTLHTQFCSYCYRYFQYWFRKLHLYYFAACCLPLVFPATKEDDCRKRFFSCRFFLNHFCVFRLVVALGTTAPLSSIFSESISAIFVVDDYRCAGAHKKNSKNGKPAGYSC